MDGPLGHLSFLVEKVPAKFWWIQDTAPLNGHFRVITMNHHVMQLKKW